MGGARGTYSMTDAPAKKLPSIRSIATTCSMHLTSTKCIEPLADPAPEGKVPLMTLGPAMGCSCEETSDLSAACCC